MSAVSLLDHLRRRVAAEGPLSLPEVMADTLTHPRFGYYATRDPFGAGGDFVTAPEVSQMFGELIGLWAAVVWQQMGSPGWVHLVELGPGRGTLMADALRATRPVPGFHTALEIHLVEASRTLREIQGRVLSDYSPTWHDDVSHLPDGPAIVIANEFFDALPIAQLQRTGAGWHERRLAFDPESGAPIWTLTPGMSPLAALVNPRILATARPGDIAEVSPASLSVADVLAKRIVGQGGAALVIDYGHARSGVGDTLQAVQAHRPVDVLATLGEADLTAHVDFAALAQVVKQAGGAAHGPTTQGAFLSALGIVQRAQALMAKATPEQARDIEAATVRLIGPDEMGTLFKVAAWTGPMDAPPPGFEA
ncbi:SAM-dependent methyltransferase [Thalassobaculum sp. OXR-137]|uniref:class I SAM-dependent methyltransferase n=1 Tax=Thalassobaculum sp. OXR-137 TaxID=3100173 RepID=UPI002AC8FCB1|nr:SAM-dependent methyltransferase [Thalassobaculum sp. OXR-137]WPZ36776.1 SAM-dependent methyltransferase [Thalassobaculum sp. OXR-137]